MPAWEDVVEIGRRFPDVFFITPHYNGYPAVLVRLEAVDLGQLAELVEDAWRVQAPKRMVAAHDAGD
jgi:hypothetical protein